MCCIEEHLLWLSTPLQGSNGEGKQALNIFGVEITFQNHFLNKWKSSILFERYKGIMRLHKWSITNFPHFIFSEIFREFFFQSLIRLIFLKTSEIFKGRKNGIISFKIYWPLFSWISLEGLFYSKYIHIFFWRVRSSEFYP